MREKIGEILIRQGHINSQQLNDGLARQKDTKKRLGETLVALGHATEDRVFAALADQWQVPFIPADKLIAADKDVLQLVPEVFARQNRVIPLHLNQAALVVAMADPDDIVVIDQLQKLSKREVDVRLAAPTAILAAIENLYSKIRKTAEVGEALGDLQFFAPSDEDE
ncbi:hypothetical protein KJ815_11095 [bacterium]|nr:hypothetical protein [bacterium]